MHIISWNVNGLRACMEKGFAEAIQRLNPDAICLQETKLSEGIEPPAPEGYTAWYCSSQKKGYSGTALLLKTAPLSITRGIGIEAFDAEGRMITAEYPGFYLVNVYTPNAQDGLKRLSFRLEWEEALRGHIRALDQVKPVILTGDLNVAHQEIDLKNPKQNRGNAGFSDEERAAFGELLETGLADSFRRLYPDTVDAYSWWSYRFRARERNAGWRIDYFLVSERLMSSVRDSCIYSDITGSDHCPVGLHLADTP